MTVVQRRRYHEKNLSAEQDPPETAPRVPGANGNQGGTPRPQGQKSEGQSQINCLMNVAPSRNYRLPRDVRLSKQGDYQRVFESKVRCSEDGFLVMALPNGLGKARLGISAPRRNVSRAYDRNRIKRVIRESFRHHKHELIGWDVVAIAGKGSAPLKNRRILMVLEKHWRKINRCKSLYSSS